MTSKTLIVPVKLFSSLTSLVRLKYGNLDSDVYAEIEKAENAIKTEKKSTMVADRESFSNMTALVRLKYGNLDADVYSLIQKAENLLS